uniref:Uncharacterized protein n=1 Tax=Zea mays TaxID=4577 RepID=C4J746_MAIZE|nr:unknown [Zea mays]
MQTGMVLHKGSLHRCVLLDGQFTIESEICRSVYMGEKVKYRHIHAGFCCCIFPCY